MPDFKPTSPQADRASQFIPFAALKGYYDLVRKQERLAQPKRDLPEEEVMRISRVLAQIDRGCVVRVMHYDIDAYVVTEGAVSRIDPAFQVLTVVKRKIAFDDIAEISVLSR